MSPDSPDDSHICISRLEPGSVRTLPLITRALRTHFRLFVDPCHGWLELNGLGVADAFCANAPGATNSADQRRVTRAIHELRNRGVLVQCRVLDTRLGHITTSDQRSLELSPWLEDDQGAHVVYPDWVPDLHRLSRRDVNLWHQARREQMAQIIARSHAESDAASPEPGPQIQPAHTTQTTEDSHAGR